MQKKYDILIIDDEQVIVDSIIKIAQSVELTSDSTPYTSTAINKLKENNYNLIISDIMMPVIDGFEFLKTISQMGITSPVIMTTGYSTIENAVKSLSNGAFDYIPKPFDADEMISIILRGIKYSILKDNQNKSFSIFYVPCPPKYYRLGNLSWIKLEQEGVVTTGITSLYTQTIENTKNIKLLEVNDLVIQSNPFAEIITEDSLIHFVPTPIGGRIIERNEKVLSDSSLAEKDPYFEGWLYKMIPADLENERKYLTPCSSDRV